jgi:hypothetical protein
MVALPLAFACTQYGKRVEEPPGSSPILAVILAAALFAIPMAARPELEPTRQVRDLLLRATGGQMATVMLATDDAEYNIETLFLAKNLAGKALRSLSVDTLVYDELQGRTLEASLDRIRNSDYVLFVRSEVPAGLEWTRTRAPQFRSYVEKVGVPVSGLSSRAFDVFRIIPAVPKWRIRSAALAEEARVWLTADGHARWQIHPSRRRAGPQTILEFSTPLEKGAVFSGHLESCDRRCEGIALEVNVDGSHPRREVIALPAPVAGRSFSVLLGAAGGETLSVRLQSLDPERDNIDFCWTTIANVRVAPRLP